MKEAEDAYFWVKFLAALAAVVATFGYRFVAVFVASCRLSLKRMPVTDIPDGSFVKRPQLESKLLNALARKTSPTVLLYGPRGSGKTALIEHALKGRRGVLAIDIDKKSHDEAQDEMITRISRKVDVFGREQDQDFLEDVFSKCVVPPVVVITLEAKCKGEVLEGVLVMCKTLSYNKRYQRQPRFIVDLSGSRAAIDASINLEGLRAVGVSVGHFSPSESLLYATERMPLSLRDPRRRESVASSVVGKFDGHVLTLFKVCEALRERQPTDVPTVEATIAQLQESIEKRASRGWWNFCCSLDKLFGAPVSSDNLKQAVELLMEEPQDILKIIRVLSNGSTGIKLSERDLGLINADAGFHPLTIDPFEKEVSLSGIPIRTVLQRRINSLGDPPSP
eukprot:CAMPEP_0113469724 /NCGR_PEP_ID=MMETSP0014_2-20120614/16053_1 /TAXON_ID=2857 /ORGANISM="Nitzschia sp." /LENGTH=392 /DNA_ID=CAMNT_0000362223 /DNA_START=55 /DNA_END=1233 /DNA_ORIENTATION=- /assembly_acc=CAM_ASM_000159